MIAAHCNFFVLLLLPFSFPVPEDFDYNPHTGKHGDRSHRMELKRSSVEYIAPSEYMVSPQSELCVLGSSRLRVHTVHASPNNVHPVIARKCRLCESTVSIYMYMFFVYVGSGPTPPAFGVLFCY